MARSSMISSTIHARLRRAGCAVIASALLSLTPARAAAEFGTFDAADVLLVVAPHPDDETLCCAGAVQRAHAAGARVAIVWITSGDAFEFAAHLAAHRLFTTSADLRELARMRMQEAAHAAELLAVPPAQQFFLGYPDGGIAQLLHEHHDVAYRSPHTGAAAVPYASALRPGAAYTGADLQRDWLSVLSRVKPTWVLAPTLLDEHADHRATGELVAQTLDALGPAARVRYWIVHGGFAWPWPRGLHLQAALDPPGRARALPWQYFALSDAERTIKTNTIRVYATQMRVTSSFMLSFVKQNEIYSPLSLPQSSPSAPVPR
jgi:LmbE family N-acetylglucosaminyl deacetylase